MEWVALVLMIALVFVGGYGAARLIDHLYGRWPDDEGDA